MAVEPLNFRFAPSPNGLLHLGHAFSALTTFEMAKQFGGRFHLRIEDIDLGRSRAEFVDAIKEDLSWLGLTWPEPITMQSERFAAYCEASQRLHQLGVLYPCAATRSEIQAAANRHDTGHDPDGAPLYPGRGKAILNAENEARINAGEPHALRLDMAKATAIATEKLEGQKLQFLELRRDGSRQHCNANPERWGDIIIVRKDVPTSYHLAVVVDDAFQNISHVTRGQDLYGATDIQRLLQVLLELPAPVYYHHALILDNTGKKLSKSYDAISLQYLRNNGKPQSAIKAMIDFAHEPC